MIANRAFQRESVKVDPRRRKRRDYEGCSSKDQIATVLRAIDAATECWSPSASSNRDSRRPDFRALAFNRFYRPNSESSEKHGRDNYAHPRIRLHVLCTHHCLADLHDIHVCPAYRDKNGNIPQRRTPIASCDCSILAKRCGGGEPGSNL